MVEEGLSVITFNDGKNVNGESFPVVLFLIESGDSFLFEMFEYVSD